MPAIHDFTHAIVRRPAHSVIAGLSAGAGPAPTYDGVSDEHARYCAALVTAGLALTILPPLEEFPDSIFVEDPALVFPAGAILLRPGAPSRAGEVATIEPALRDKFDEVLAVTEGSVDGGDILQTPRAVMIGLSARTDEKGARALAAALETLGLKARIVHTPEGVLHFKTDCALLDDETVLATPRLAASGVFAGMKVIETSAGEEAAANALRIRDVVLIGADYPHTAEKAATAGYRVETLPVGQIGRIDAGLSCMSLRWRSARSD